MTTHLDLHRDIGRMEGRLDAMDDSLSEIKYVLKEMNSRLAKIESNESERSGQMTYAQLAEHMRDDPAFAAFVEKEVN